MTNWQHKYIENGRIIEVRSSRPEKPSFLLADDSRPGYVDSEHLKWLLEKRCLQLKTPTFGSILAMLIMNYDDVGYSNGTVFHTGLFLGNINGKPTYVEQDGLGGSFKVKELNGRLKILEMSHYMYSRQSKTSNNRLINNTIRKKL